MRSMQPGDLFFFYHSSCPQPGIAGIARIASAHYPDPTALEPESHYFDAKASAAKNPWSAVDVAFVEAFKRVIPLAQLKAQSALLELPLARMADAPALKIVEMRAVGDDWRIIAVPQPAV
jgi:predicted RNA-binding protein with PUA-like domain